MADISSLMNPPEETENPTYPAYEAPYSRKRRLKNEDYDYREESDDSEDPAEAEPAINKEIRNVRKISESSTEPVVSQNTILSSFDRIKTHFPAARIKKIMQLDEDIGKVAQATPIVVGRALEIFMANLVEAAIIETKSAGMRRIGASHVRAAVEKTEQFDFLVDVVRKYLPTKNLDSSAE